LKRADTKHGDEDTQIDLRAVVADCPHEEEGEACEDHDARDEELTSHWFVPGSHGDSDVVRDCSGGVVEVFGEGGFKEVV
jgi:hypothetical protein